MSVETLDNEPLWYCEHNKAYGDGCKKCEWES